MENTCPILIHSTDHNYGNYIRCLVNQFGIPNTVLAGHALTWKKFNEINPQLAIFATDCGASSVLIKAIKKKSYPLIVISHDDLPNIRETDNLTCLGKPFYPGILKEAIGRQLTYNSNAPPSDTLNEPFIIGNTKKICDTRKVIASISKTDLTVLILGGTGTGKGIVASAIQSNSRRKLQPFLQVNCANIPSSLLESELFGYKKGAFTGAWEDKPGKFNIADSGTIFLDEISEMSWAMQAKILQVLQEGEFSPVGGVEDTKVNVRIIAATNANPMELINQGRLREDFYYRLNVINITLPRLRERREDISLLIEHFIEKYCLLYNKKSVQLSKRLFNMVMSYDWPGNVRELENAIKSIIALENENFVLDELKKKMVQAPFEDNLLYMKLRTYDDIGRLSLREISHKIARQAEENAIRDALDVSGGNKKKAANLLEVSYKSILNKIKEYSL